MKHINRNINILETLTLNLIKIINNLLKKYEVTPGPVGGFGSWKNQGPQGKLEI